MSEEKQTIKELKKCPFCGGQVFERPGHQGISYFLCGQRDDGADGCGAVVSFRPALSGDKALLAWNKRYTMCVANMMSEMKSKLTVRPEPVLSLSRAKPKDEVEGPVEARTTPSQT